MSLVYTQTAMPPPAPPRFLAPLPGLCSLATVTLNFSPSCLHFPSVEIIGVRHYTSLYGAGYRT